MKYNHANNPTPQFLADQRRKMRPAHGYLLSACLTLNLLCLSSAQAEFRIGVELSPASTTNISAHRPASPRIARVSAADADHDAKPVIGIFGQYRRAVSERITLGLHLGYSEDSSTWQDQRTLAYSFGEISSNFELTSDYTYDLLGVVGIRWKKVNPYFMLGYSKMKFNGSQTTDIRFGPVSVRILGTDRKIKVAGWKLVAGLEIPLRNAWFSNVALKIADYDDHSLPLRGRLVPAVSRIFVLSEDVDLRTKTDPQLHFTIGYSFGGGGKSAKARF